MKAAKQPTRREIIAALTDAIRSGVRVELYGGPAGQATRWRSGMWHIVAVDGLHATAKSTLTGDTTQIPIAGIREVKPVPYQLIDPAEAVT